MIDLLMLALGFLGLLSLLKGRHSDTTVYEESPVYYRPSYEVPGYQDDEHIRQSRRREREKDRRTTESRWHRCT
jgi:hypothetical protein